MTRLPRLHAATHIHGRPTGPLAPRRYRHLTEASFLHSAQNVLGCCGAPPTEHSSAERRPHCRAPCAHRCLPNFTGSPSSGLGPRQGLQPSKGAAGHGHTGRTSCQGQGRLGQEALHRHAPWALPGGTQPWAAQHVITPLKQQGEDAGAGWGEGHRPWAPQTKRNIDRQARSSVTANWLSGEARELHPSWTPPTACFPPTSHSQVKTHIADPLTDQTNWKDAAAARPPDPGPALPGAPHSDFGACGL